MSKKKIIKKKVVAKPVKKIKAVKVLKASPFEDTIKAALNHILQLFKAALIDAFKQYIASRIQNSLPASVEDFTKVYAHTVAAHGIADEVLLQSLDEVELEYLANPPQVHVKKTLSRGKKAAEPVVEANVDSAPLIADTGVKEPVAEKSDTKSVFDLLDLI